MANDDFTDDRNVRDENPEQTDNFFEETAAEIAGVRPDIERNDHINATDQEQIEDDAGVEGRGIGIFGLILSLLSLLFLPVLLGAAGIIVGFFARRRGANALGNWAMAVGAISIVVSLFLAPFF